MMGNNIGSRNKAKIVKINGEILKQKLPAQAQHILKDYPEHVLLEKGEVKKHGIRAKPLAPEQPLYPNKAYFLIQIPKFRDQRLPRRSTSSVHVTAKDRLEWLKLKQRSASDLSVSVSSSSAVPVHQVKVKLPKAEVERLLKESGDEDEAAEKIVDLYLKSCGRDNNKGKVVPEDYDESQFFSTYRLN